jgi:hypothetical protein
LALQHNERAGADELCSLAAGPGCCKPATAGGG